MVKHKTGTRQEWMAARLKLLAAEKELTHRSDALALQRARRLAECHVVKEAVNCRKAGVASARSVAALSLEGVEELRHEGSVDVFKGEARGCLAEVAGCKPKEEPEGVTVGGDGVGARRPLLNKSVDEEALQERLERHGRTRFARLSRPVARLSNSGTASRYQ